MTPPAPIAITTETLHKPFLRGDAVARQHGGSWRSLRPHVLRMLGGQRVTPAQMVADVTTVLVALALAVVGAGSAHVALDGPYARYAFPVALVAALWASAARRTTLRTSLLDELRSVATTVTAVAMGWIALGAVFAPNAAPGPAGVRLWAYSLVCVAIGRAGVVWTRRAAHATRELANPVLIVGAGRVGVQIGERLLREPEYGLQPVGFLDVEGGELGPADEHGGDEPFARDAVAPLLGGIEQLAEAAKATGARHVILAFPAVREAQLVACVQECEARGLSVMVVPRLFEWTRARQATGHLGALPLEQLPIVDPHSWRFSIKYGIDRVVAAGLVLLMAPLLGALALAVKLSSPGPVLFRQRRIGRDGQVFDILKFRSMREPEPGEEQFRPASGCAPGGVEATDRRTRVGTWLRRTSLDELPQVINVMRGEMSLIGPRPERPEFVEQFGQEVWRYGDRHRVKSGITGWAQVHGLRGQTSLTERVEYDNFYIQNWSLWMDLKTALLTVPAVLAMDAE